MTHEDACGPASAVHGSSRRRGDRVARLTLECAAMALMGLAACGSAAPLRPSRHNPGQIADDFGGDPTRALVIARIDVKTDGRAGFGPIGNPLLLQLAAGNGVPSPRAEELTIPDLNPLSVGDPNDPYYTGTYGPMLWQYAPPGLLAASVRPGTYDAMIPFYPDTLRIDRPVDSIPAPDRPLGFSPVTIVPDAIVYLGDVEIDQRIGWADLLLDRIRMNYAVVDRYAEATAEFRERYPQFRDARIEKHILSPVVSQPSASR